MSKFCVRCRNDIDLVVFGENEEETIMCRECYDNYNKEIDDFYFKAAAMARCKKDNAYKQYKNKYNILKEQFSRSNFEKRIDIEKEIDRLETKLEKINDSMLEQIKKEASDPNVRKRIEDIYDKKLSESKAQ